MRKWRITKKEKGKRAKLVIAGYVNEEAGEVYYMKQPLLLEKGSIYKVYYGNSLEATFSPKNRDMYLRANTDLLECYIPNDIEA